MAAAEEDENADKDDPAGENALADDIGRLASAETNVRRAALRQLRPLVRAGDTAADLLHAGLIEALVSLLSGTQANSEERVQAAQMLADLCQSPDGSRRAAAAGGCQLLVRGLRGPHPVEACKALAGIAGDKDGRDAIEAAGGGMALVDIVGRAASQHSVQLEATCALRNLALGADNRIRIVASGGHDVLVGLVEMNGERPVELRTAAAATLANLALYRYIPSRCRHPTRA